MDQGLPTEEQRTTGVSWPEQNQSSQGQANFTDSAGPLFHMYVKMTEGEDEKMANRWQKDADGILIFHSTIGCGLCQDLRPNPQDTSAFYLTNIYQLLADSNISRESILATPAQPPPFSPPRSAVLVNSLWFLSLVVSLTCALLATMLQQWARRYVEITQPPRYSPYKRAPIRAFFANGVDKFHLPWSVEALPALLHLSLFLFFSGLVLFLFNINHTVFSVVIWWVGLAGAVYGCITLMPIFWHDSPYYSPLSSSAWFFYTSIRYAVSRIVRFLWPYGCLFGAYYTRPGKYRRQLFGGMTKAVQGTGSKLSVEINNRILTWIIHALDEDKELEQFFEAIPGFCASDVVLSLGLNLIFAKVDETLAASLFGFMGRTLTSSLVSEADKKRRVITCMKAVDTAHLGYATMYVLGRIFLNDVGLLRSVELGRSLRSRGDGDPGLCSQGIIAGVIASVPERDDRWIALVMDQLGVSEEVLRNYLANGDSVLLANLIHITRPLFRLCLKDVEKMSYVLLYLLSCISKVDIRNTLPTLQHDFCALWNEIVREAHIRGSFIISSHILMPIQHLYIALHPGTDVITTDFDPFEPSSYQLCNISAHGSNSAIGEITDPNLIIPSTEHVLSPSPSLSPDHRRISFAEQTSLHDLPDGTPSVESSRNTPLINVESSNVVTTSLDLITQGPTDTATMTSSPTSDSQSSPHAPGLSTFTLHTSFAPPSSGSTNPHNNVDPSVATDIPLRSSSPTSVRSGTVPEITSATAIFPAAAEGTSVSCQNIGTAPNDRTVDDRQDPVLRYNVDGLEQFQESAMSVPEAATDVLCLRLDTASVSRDIDHPE
ncbi:hypothetical protein BGW80DRAFT_1254096 [Lactifluus volemus]|nr:hypothetical protein BGW80DRAFT_1254096 [Lactifluus volemus]